MHERPCGAGCSHSDRTTMHRNRVNPPCGTTRIKSGAGFAEDDLWLVDRVREALAAVKRGRFAASILTGAPVRGSRLAGGPVDDAEIAKP